MASTLKCSLAPVLWWAYWVASACEASRAGEKWMSGRQFLCGCVSWDSHVFESVMVAYRGIVDTTALAVIS
jgi:hypothetical protein